MSAPATELRTIGKYEVEDLIGSGGGGSVYRGRDPVTGKTVAIKVIKGEMLKSPVLLKRFEQEFHAARRLDHPNIVRGLDFGMEGSLPYLVLEFVDGPSLGDRIEAEKRLPEAEAVRIVCQAARALHAAHQRGIIHRDIKPDNILLTSAGEVKIADLGLVKLVNAEFELTQDFSMLGTPNFMAPEQFENAKRVDVRCDVYSLGATLYMAVTGELPFRVRSNRNPLSILKKKLQDEITPPRKLVPDLSEQVDFAIRRAIRSNPGQRQASCLELVETLTERPAPAPMTMKMPAVDRRAAVRYATSLATTCRPVARVKEEAWEATIKNVSTSGACLLLDRRFEPGTVLVVELPGKKQGAPRLFLARVLRAVEEADEKWAVGCAFIRRLHDAELQEIL